MSSAWFGLIGVIVGGLIATIWSWLALVRQELSDAMVAARLVDQDLSERQQSDVAGARATIWTQNRVALAKVLGQPQWEAVASVYNHPARAEAEPLAKARGALAPLVAGKRYVVPQRWRNMLRFSRR